MKTIKRNIFIILITCILLSLGYYRDFVFVNINALLKARDFRMDYSMPSSLEFFNNYGYNTLVKIKWLLTLLFSGFYLILSSFAISLLFNNKKYLNITIAVYIIVTIVSGLFIASGLIFETIGSKMYDFSRYLMGMLQSPIILMILIPTFKLLGNELQEKNSK